MTSSFGEVSQPSSMSASDITSSQFLLYDHPLSNSRYEQQLQTEHDWWFFFSARSANDKKRDQRH